jgi:predicted branched-subunit amino acid permease
MRDVVPLLAGYLPFALVIGIAVAAADPLLARWLGTILILGGSAHLVTLELLDAGSSLLLVIAAGLVTNARLLAYSASLAPAWRVQPRWFRLVGAALLIDPTWALAQRNLAGGRGHQPTDHRAYYLGAGITLAAGWFGLVSLGMVTGDHLREVVGDAPVLALAAPFSLAALVAPQLIGRPALAAAGTAAVTGWLTAGWPVGTGLLLAVVAATAVAAAFDTGDDTDPAPESP